MGIVRGSIKVETSEEELAYSEDPGVIAGKRDGCGWVPVHEFDRVDASADVVIARTLDADQRTQARNIETRIGAASANVFVALASLREVRTMIDGKVVRLTGDGLADWVKAVARTNPKPIDHLAERVLVVTESGDLEADYAANRRFFGKRAPEEVRDDATSKSGE